jgi:hypothetical protein
MSPDSIVTDVDPAELAIISAITEPSPESRLVILTAVNALQQAMAHQAAALIDKHKATPICQLLENCTYALHKSADFPFTTPTTDTPAPCVDAAPPALLNARTTRVSRLTNTSRSSRLA